jgi:hypothetical protein
VAVMFSLRPLLLAGVVAAALAPAAAHAGVTSGSHTVASYDLSGTYASSIGTAGPLTPLGATHAFDSTTRDGQSVGYLHVNPTSGVKAPVAGLSAAYSVAVDFRLSDVADRNRVLGFKNTVVDDGFYVVDGALVFDNGNQDTKKAVPTPIAENTWTHLVVTRNQDWLVKVYVNDQLEFTYIDTPDDLALTALTVFTDDNGERAAGDLTRLQLFDGELSANEATGMVHYDGVAPTAELVSPAAFDGKRYLGTDTYGSGTVTDEGTQVLPADVRLEKLNGDVIAQRDAFVSPPAGPFGPGVSMTNVFNYAFVGAPVLDGEQYNLVVESVDKAGNATEHVTPAYGDTTPPSGLTIATPGDATDDTTPTLSGLVPASKREAAYTTARICRGVRCDIAQADGMVAMFPVWPQGGTYALELTGDAGKPLTPGIYTVSVTSCDSAENCQLASRRVAIAQPPLHFDPDKGPAIAQPANPPVNPSVVHAQIGPLRAAAIKALKKTSARRLRRLEVDYRAAYPGVATVQVLSGRKLVAHGKRTYKTAGRGTIVVRAKRKVPRKVTVRVQFSPRGGPAVTSTARVTLKR